MYIHKNHLIKSLGLYTISVKKKKKKNRGKKKLFSLSVLQMECELSNLRLFFRLRLCLNPVKKNCIVCQVGIVTYVFKQFDRLNLSSLKKSL